MLQAPMLDGGDKHARFAVVGMRVDFCKFDAQAQQLQPKHGIPDFTHQVRQRALVHRAGITHFNWSLVSKSSQKVSISACNSCRAGRVAHAR